MSFIYGMIHLWCGCTINEWWNLLRPITYDIMLVYITSNVPMSTHTH